MRLAVGYEGEVYRSDFIFNGVANYLQDDDRTELWFVHDDSTDEAEDGFCVETWRLTDGMEVFRYPIQELHE